MVSMMNMKKLVSLVLALTMFLSLCAFASAEEEKTYTIGIIQFADHPSLDNCREGFIAGMEEAGFVEGVNVTYIYQNAQSSVSDCSLIAENMLNTCDMICAIATPAAQAAYNACDGTGVPVIYTAVSDPIAADLAGEDKLGVGNVTGTSDELPVAAQLALIHAMLPEAKTVGILHTTSETNSDSTLATYRALAAEYSLEIVDKGIADISELYLALDALLSQVDCTTNLTDNTVVSGLELVLEKSREAGKPVFGSEVEQVKNGCVAAAGIDYVLLGRQTGMMAARVLNGEEAQQIAFETFADAFLYANEEAMAEFGITLPAEYAENTEFVTADAE